MSDDMNGPCLNETQDELARVWGVVWVFFDDGSGADDRSQIRHADIPLCHASSCVPRDVQRFHDASIAISQVKRMLFPAGETSREGNMFAVRLKAAVFVVQQTFYHFDFRFNEQSLTPATLRDLATCRFIEQQRNVAIGDYLCAAIASSSRNSMS